METTGKLSVKMDTITVSEKFKKREFVMTIGDQYPQEVMFELTQSKTELLDGYNVGEEVKVHFNLRGKKWEKDGKVSYFNKLEAWKLEKVGAGQTNQETAQTQTEQGQTVEDDPLPF